MRPLILLLLFALTFSSLQGKSQKKGDDKKDKEDTSDDGDEEDKKEEKDDFVGVRFSNKTNKATFGFNNVTGTLQVYNSTMKSSKLELQVVILEEFDENDMIVGEEGAAYHDLQMVEVDEWVLSEPENCTIEEGKSNITATCISANGTITLINNTNVVFKAALVEQDGVIDLDGEETPVKAGNVRVSVIVENWLWCCKTNSTGCEVCPVPSKDDSKESKKDSDEKEKERELQIGSYLHVGLSLVTPDNKIRETAKFVFSEDKMHAVGTRQYGAGDGAFLLLSSQVGIDDKWMDMKKGFPKIQNKDSKTMISFACDKFSSNCRYDLIFIPSSASYFEASLIFVLILTIVTVWQSFY